MTAERLSITVSEDCAQTIRELAKQNNTTVSGEIRTALKVYIDEAIEGKTENAVIDAYEARISALEQRIKDMDQIIKSKNETIEALELFIKLEPEERREGDMDTSPRDNFV